MGDPKDKGINPYQAKAKAEAIKVAIPKAKAHKNITTIKEYFKKKPKTVKELLVKKKQTIKVAIPKAKVHKKKVTVEQCRRYARAIRHGDICE